MRNLGTIFTVSFAVAVSLLPTSAFACGMYIPPEREELMTELFSEIDNAEVETAVVDPALTEAQILEAAEMNASIDTVNVETTEVQIDTVVDDSRPHRKLFGNRRNH